MRKLKANPRLFINLVTAVVGAATAFGLKLSAEQVAAVMSLTVMATSFIVGDDIKDREVTRS